MIYEILFQKVNSKCCRFIHFSNWVLAPRDLVQPTHTEPYITLVQIVREI